MKYYIVDDSKAVVLSLSKMIEDKDFGTVAGKTTDPYEAELEIQRLMPDIVLVDYLMPEMDGVELVTRIKEKCPDIAFVMLSKVSDKKMVAKAYDAGIEFFMSKPVSIIEANRVLGNVAERLKMKRIVSNIYDALGDGRSGASGSGEPGADSGRNDSGGGRSSSQADARAALQEAAQVMSLSDQMHRVDILLGAIDMRTQKGTVYIKQLIELMCLRGCDYDKDMLDEIAERNNISLKNLEQQLRRAIKRGMQNAARIGLADFDNEAFVVYAGYVYDFASLREEMNYIRGTSSTGGRVSIAGFLNGLKLYVECS